MTPEQLKQVELLLPKGYKVKRGGILSDKPAKGVLPIGMKIQKLRWCRYICPPDPIIDSPERIIWTVGPFSITKAKRDGYRVWFGMAFVGLFPKLKQAKERIENNRSEFGEI